MFGKRKEYFTKHYRRRTFFGMVFCYVTFLSAFREEVKPILSNYRPFAPHTHVDGPNGIKVKWLPFSPYQNNGKIFYELYNNDDLEYRGRDLTHNARRLNTHEEYKFQLRVCNELVINDCSKLSRPRYQILKDSSGEVSTSEPSTIVTTVIYMVVQTITISFFVLGFCYCCICWVIQRLNTAFDKASNVLGFGGNRKYDISFECIEDFFDIEAKGSHTTRPKSKSFSNQGPHEKTVETLQRSPRKKKRRTRSKTNYSNQQEIINECSFSDSELYCSKKVHNVNTSVNKLQRKWNLTPNVTKNSVSDSNIMVVIDNSNIFIGAREAVCNLHPQVKSKQVKLRLQQLMSIIENKRRVTRAFTGGSSSPGNDSVWEIYRRHGYVVDVEERRGKGEQRVDEQLHLAIYKALVELTPQTLVLVTGDGNKGKSKGDTSFINCALKAIEYGWNVEVLSWKHSLSAEWIRLMARNEKRLKIIYLDQYVSDITTIDRKPTKRKMPISKHRLH